MKCSICGTEFTPLANRRKYCTEDCSRWAEINRYRRRDFMKRCKKSSSECALTGMGGLREHLARLTASGGSYK